MYKWGLISKTSYDAIYGNQYKLGFIWLQELLSGQIANSVFQSLQQSSSPEDFLCSQSTSHRPTKPMDENVT
jgi:hypothetical protein